MAMAEKLDLNSLLKRFEALPTGLRFAVLGGVVAVVFGVYYVGFFGSKRTELVAVEQKLEKVESSIQSAKAVAANLESFKKKREELQAQLQDALRKLPSSSDLPQLLTDITSLGKKSGLEIQSFKRGPKVDRGFYSEQQILLKFNGRYHDIGMFFDRLAKLDRIVNITKLEMKLINDVDVDPRLNVSGVAATFFFNESQQTATAGGE
jgi:type IV pilus assembly protein PilO